MIAARLACAAPLGRVVLIFCAAVVPGRAWAVEPQTPLISDRHRLFLSRVAQRVVRDAVSNRGDYEPSYQPPALQELQAEVVVRLRRDGYLLSTGVGGPACVIAATRDGALQAAKQAIDNGSIGAQRFGGIVVELEVVGDPIAIEFDGDWTQPRALDAFIEPGVHGMVVAGPRGRQRFCPSEVFTNDIVLSDALKELAKHTHGDSEHVISGSLMKFRTTHWYLPPAANEVVSLHRGLVVVPASAVSPQGLDEAIGRIAEYMAYRQLPTGLFTYQYEPGLDRYTDDDNIVRQVGATLAMAVHARFSGKSASLGAADLAIRNHLTGLTTIPDVDEAAFIGTDDGEHKLGVSALMCLAMAAHPQADRFEATRRQLVNGMLWLQRRSGMFITAFPPAERLSGQDYFPGEALLALATEYDRRPTAPVLDAFDRAIEFYRGYFRDRPSPAFVPWQVQAYAIMARHTKRSDYREFVFVLTDWLADKQLTESNCDWPEMWGGIASYQPGRAGVSTAAYLEAFTDALTLARFVGDNARVQRYTELVRGAARFVMQLQFRPEEAFYVRSPQDAVGGIRTTPTLNLLRIDHCQHALIALIKTKAVLFP